MARQWLWVIGVLVGLFIPVAAQDSQTILALRTDSNALQTGEFYTIRVEIDDVRELWSATMTLTYDPEQLYVIGTLSGSPVELGDMLASGSIVVQNQVDSEQGQIVFTPSRINPADPVSGGGVLGVIQVVPLQAGDTQIAFEQADLSRVLFDTNDDGERIYGSSERIEFAVTVLDLSITGDPATPPPEASATPTPTATIDPIVVRDAETDTVEPTLAVVTDAPQRTPTPAPDVATVPDDASGIPLLLYVAVGLVLLAIGGLLGLFFVARRRT